ncbi:hypothetical protein CANMA_001023 [Candida margitis]|uniref:uncharacterized protein n=1 Tax=Candida margitis TaxID=1775924 RepID=UPI0022263293|nr:uncharacterized protein CANMA_001023 [Candida margitis]KAI5969983.1 hypothetical protein CANMA_001023 [Candida margitis]
MIQVLHKLTLRKSRGILLVFGIVLIHILVVTYFQSTPLQEYISNVSISKLRKLLVGQDSYKDISEFDIEVVDLVQSQEKLLKQQSSQGTFDDKTQKQLDVTEQVLKETTFNNDNSFHVINIPSRDQIPQFQIYDPRFTFGLLLKYINANINDQDQQQLQHQNLTIPFFHWADYTDMSVMEDYLFNPEKQSCKYFDATIDEATNKDQKIYETKDYCVEDDEINRILLDPEAQQNYPPHVIASFQRIKHERESSPALTTGFHIYDRAGRNKRELRPIIARSYLHDFMPSPLTMTVLLPGDKSIQFEVNQYDRKKLRDSELLQEGDVNIKEQITSLANKLPTRIEDLPFEKHLTPEHFVDKTAHKVMTLESQKSPLNQTDQQYLNSLRTSLNTQDAPKYFYEANIMKSEKDFVQGGHYDWRFINGIINDTPMQEVSINGLLKAFLRLTNQYNINTWIAHGSLLSWYWNGLQFPWDADIDVQMPIQDLHKLSQLFNQSIIVDFGNDLNSEMRFGRYYVDSSTFISHRAKGKGLNNIDARFVDLDTGLYVDITALALSDEPAPDRYNSYLADTEYDRNKGDKSISQIDRNAFLQIYNCRNKHFSGFNELSPLRLSSIQGDYGYIPPGFESMLLVEYKEKGIASTVYKNRVYLPKLRLWVYDKSITEFVEKYVKNDGGGDDKMKTVKEGDVQLRTFNLTNEEYIEYMYQNEPVMQDFIASHDVTSLHNLEIQSLLDKVSTKDLFVKYGTDLLSDDATRANLRLDHFVYKSRTVEGGYDFNNELKRLRGKVREVEVAWKEKQEGTSEDKPVEVDGDEMNKDGTEA